MNRDNFFYRPSMKFEIHQVNSTGKIRDSPTSSILKTPTAIFVTTRNSTTRTKKLKFANGPVDLRTLKNGTHESNASYDSGVDVIEDKKLKSNGEISFENSFIEVAISPVKTMQVSPESWKAFLEYKKYNDYANETEKTDYTYSRMSKFRHKEIIPGFLVRPNLSRSSISSRRSSVSLQNSFSSLNDLFKSSNYDFKVHNLSSSNAADDIKISSQPTKFIQSKYYLRSSNTDWKDATETESNNKNSYLEKEYYLHSPSEKFRKSYSYTTSERPEPTSYYYGNVRSMDFDDADIDEVDVDPVHSEKHNYISPSASNRNDASWLRDRGVEVQSFSDSFKNFFTTMFFYIAYAGTFTRDLFSKYILRRSDGWENSQFYSSWRNDAYDRSMNKSWMPWKQSSVYSSESYYTGGYYGQPRSWYQKIFYYFGEKFSQFANLFGSNTNRYATYRYQETSKKRFWWLLLPVLLLAGSFLGYIDFFSNPKAILNILYNWALFIPSFIHYTFTVFIPWLIFEGAPYFVLKAIPNFVMNTLPYFFMNVIPHYFWYLVHFFGNMTLSSAWAMLVGAFSFALNFITITAGALGSFVFKVLLTGYQLSSTYLLLFYSNFCVQVFSLFTVFSESVVFLFDYLHKPFFYMMTFFE